jgi:uncharacterized membrane protein YkvA (DUF1232 family)
MGDFLKGVLVTLLVIGYVVMPDFFPGPIDDLIVIILAITGTVGKKKYID